MEKIFVKLAIVYAVIAMIGGIFFREFTKFQHFEGLTTLSVVHTHYFLLGMFFFLILAVLEKTFKLSEQGNVCRNVGVYQIGLNITGIMLFARGITDVVMPELSKGADAAISGISGIGHILLGVSLILILLKVQKSVR